MQKENLGKIRKIQDIGGKIDKNGQNNFFREKFANI